MKNKIFRNKDEKIKKSNFFQNFFGLFRLFRSFVRLFRFEIFSICCSQKNRTILPVKFVRYAHMNQVRIRTSIISINRKCKCSISLICNWNKLSLNHNDFDFHPVMWMFWKKLGFVDHRIIANKRPAPDLAGGTSAAAYVDNFSCLGTDKKDVLPTKK